MPKKRASRKTPEDRLTELRRFLRDMNSLYKQLSPRINGSSAVKASELAAYVAAIRKDAQLGVYVLQKLGQ
ncbi:MAG TPA: hypothetical protein V6C86_05735 [Oculatellaceae cyanobacterium]